MGQIVMPQDRTGSLCSVLTLNFTPISSFYFDNFVCFFLIIFIAVLLG